jgi:hypothetical protein
LTANLSEDLRSCLLRAISKLNDCDATCRFT